MMKRSKLMWTAALLAVMFAAPSFAASGDAELLKAARGGDTAAARALINAGANVNAQDDDGMTALMWTAFWGHTDAVRLLLNAGANANMQDNRGETALIKTAQWGRASSSLLAPAR